jgi:Cu-Zn family superoxide dismutase
VIIMSIFATRPDAVAYLKGGKETPKVHGEVKFYQEQKGVLVVAKVSNLPKDNHTGFFGFHIHEGIGCSGENFADTGSHYAPSASPHPMHAGDLPPLLAVNGQAYLAVETDRFRVEEILGRTVVIHSQPDDFTSQPAGNAGTKIACGVIRRP